MWKRRDVNTTPTKTNVAREAGQIETVKMGVDWGSEGYGSLTEVQKKDLSRTARLSPGYRLTVMGYPGGGIHVVVSSMADESGFDNLGLVGRDCCQYYDAHKQTEKVVKRVANYVFRRSVYFA